MWTEVNVISDDWNSKAETLRSLIGERKFAEAEVFCAELLRSDPANHWLNTRMAAILRGRGKYSKALPYARAALAADITCAGCQQSLADTLYYAGDYHSAIVAATAAQKLGGPEADALETIVWANFALRAYDQVVGHTEAGQSRGVSTESLVRHHGRALALLGRIAEAHEVLISAESNSTYDVQAQLGLMEYRLNQLEPARSRLIARVRSGGTCRAWAFLALVYGEESWTRAVDYARQAVSEAQSPTDSQYANSTLAVCLANTKDIAGAEEAISQVPAAEPWNNLRLGASLVIAVAKEDVKNGASFALSVRSWDDSGDIGLPFIQTSLRKLIDNLTSKPRPYLVESLALLMLDPLRMQ